VYKRNQIEDAISKILDPRTNGSPTEIVGRIKRLLETDRARGRSARSNDPTEKNFAFYRHDAPGSGVEVWFSEYEAFALLTGLLLMANGWTQGVVVSILRQVRREMETEHTTTMKQDIAKLFDEGAIRRDARAGDIAFDNTDPVLLVIAASPKTKASDGAPALHCAVRRGPAKAFEFISDSKGALGGFTMFELASNAHRLHRELEKTEPSKRGRSTS